MPGYSTKRLPGLDVVPSDAKAMMRAKASKKKISSCGGIGGGDAINNGVGGVGGGEGANPGGGGTVVSGRLEAASRVVAATTLCQ